MEAINQLLGIGLDAEDLTVLQVCIRGPIIFLACLVMVRVGDKRFLSRRSAFDAVLGFILASMMARAVNGSAPFLPTICGGFVLVLLHRFLAFSAKRSHLLGGLIKGHGEILIEDGELKPETARRHNFSERDILEDLRLKGVASPNQVKLAYIERNGDISVVKD